MNGTNSTNATHSHHSHHHLLAHLIYLEDGSISSWGPYTAMIVTVLIVVIFAYRLYFVEGFLMNTKPYKEKYQKLQIDQQRSLVNHHVAGTCKLILLFMAAYPFLAVAFFKSNPHTPWAHGSAVTLGDIMIICSSLFTVMYAFELFYRVNVSPISAAHHVGAILIAQTAVAYSLDPTNHPDSVIEFLMCFVWGAFDVVAELWPHIAMILYRLLPAGNDHSARALEFHAQMAKIFLSVAIMEIAGTTIETTIVFWLWGTLWERWTLPFKVVTPILHLLFSCAQLWGAHVFWQLSKKEKRKAAGLRRASVVAQVETTPLSSRAGSSTLSDKDVKLSASETMSLEKEQAAVHTSAA